MTNLHYNDQSKKLICDQDPEATNYEFCVAPSGTDDWDSEITTFNYRSVVDKSGSKIGKGRIIKNAELGAFCSPIEFNIT